MQIKYLSIILLAVAFVIVPSSVYAETATNAAERLKETQKEIKELQQEKKQALKDERIEMMQIKKQTRAEFQAKLKLLKDEKKKLVVERIDTQIQAINTKRTKAMLETVEKLQTINTNLQQKVSKAKAAGQDTATAEAAINAANTAILKARTDVTGQSIKQYVVQITDETALKQTVGETISTLQQDLKTVHAVVVAAKQSVMTAAKEVATLQPVSDSSATGSAVIQ